ncbi:hypothetical protein B0E46_04025 [Rhodanobacter sp. B04]|uniref:TolB family protein n=1 Tax=Rhodanobacter sp. B04 TaxID=1945860 RepID=UPI0009CBDEE8|nr:PD40 domain-containing protein [Rhodanobacter sp. B04]OOG65521.1 hypothetical protein B0E46_04025 [Rhodanobacter sp. B04]
MYFVCLKTVAIVALITLLGVEVAATPSVDGSSVRFVTSDADGEDYGPAFSPDGTRIIFERHPLGPGRWTAYSVEVSSGDIRSISKEVAPVEETRLCWSSTTNEIAFTGLAADKSASTWLMKADGTHIRAAYPSSKSQFFYPSWYPSGTQIAELDGSNNTIRKVDLVTGKSEVLTQRHLLLAGMSSVSPDGKWIALAAQPNRGQSYDQTKNTIWLISSTGDAHPLEQDPQEGRAPSWSPDGTRIAFESNRSSLFPGFYAVFVATKDGRNIRQLTPYALNAQHPVWSPDGRLIAFSARQPKAGGKYGPGIAVIAAPSQLP